MTPRLLAFGSPLLYQLITTSADVAVDFFSSTERKFRRIRDQGWFVERRLEIPVRRWTVADLARLSRAVASGRYTAILCEHVRHRVWSRAEPWHANVGGACRTLARERESLLRLFLPSLARRGGVPMAFLNLDDVPSIEPQDWALLRASRAAFVRELPINPAHLVLGLGAHHWRRPASIVRRRELDWLWSRLRPISIGLPDHMAAAIRDKLVDRPDDKDIDVFFAGWTAPYTQRDDRYVRQLLSLRDEGWRVEIPGRALPRGEFLERLARSWLAWSPQGSGWECWRHYEAAAAGTVPIINAPTIRRHAPLQHGRHALFYEVEGEHLRWVASEALRRKDVLWDMGRSARRHVLAHHLHSGLLRSILGAVSVDVDCPSTEPVAISVPGDGL